MDFKLLLWGKGRHFHEATFAKANFSYEKKKKKKPKAQGAHYIFNLELACT